MGSIQSVKASLRFREGYQYCDSSNQPAAALGVGTFLSLVTLSKCQSESSLYSMTGKGRQRPALQTKKMQWLSEFGNLRDLSEADKFLPYTLPDDRLGYFGSH
ncbi:hypothetical protein OPV22_031745 [Ensete ventricosum]|uniref:Uncharacterized protein n=1 Tax=Ensete ventricosum TaxID=4639 RepID=A0AAV8PXD6_ENSVE|nr:hypothetical protein OPV22_031745 [Ensete ventricosum]